MSTLSQLVVRQECRCHNSGTTMLTDCVRAHPQQATVEHLIDKWSSPKHIKIEDEGNLVAACYTCNNTRGNARNKIARNYYKQLNEKRSKKIQVASTSSKVLYKMFGAIPQELFKSTTFCENRL